MSEWRRRVPATAGRSAAVAAVVMLALALAGAAASAAVDSGGETARSAANLVEQKGPDGSTPLQWAVYRQDVSEVKRLLKAGANVAEANDYGATPMQMAAATGNTAILKLLLDAGADADSPNADGQTALMEVARTGNVDAAKLLLKHGAKVDARETFGDQTALMWASARRHPQMMELLIKHGADVNARSIWRNWERHVTAESRAKRTNAGGLTPLMYAARENCLACVDVLLKHHVDVDRPDPDGFAPVTIAILNNNWDIAKRLIDAGADVNQWDIYGQGPLYAAIASGVDVPGSRAGSSIDPPNQATGRDIVKLLLAKGANPNMQLFYRPPNHGFGFGFGGPVAPPASRGSTPLIAAAAMDDVELVKELLAAGADPKLYQADDQTPIMAALGGRGAFGGGGADDPQKAVEVIRLLHDAGTDINVDSIQHHLLRTRGGTALHFAVRAGDKEAMQELIGWGIDVNAKDPDGLTALDYAMGRGYVPFLQQRKPPRPDLAKLLLDAGANVQLAKMPDWPAVGPPIGYEATIWPLQPSDGLRAASTKYPPMYDKVTPAVPGARPVKAADAAQPAKAVPLAQRQDQAPPVARVQ